MLEFDITIFSPSKIIKCCIPYNNVNQPKKSIPPIARKRTFSIGATNIRYRIQKNGFICQYWFFNINAFLYGSLSLHLNLKFKLPLKIQSTIIFVAYNKCYYHLQAAALLKVPMRLMRENGIIILLYRIGVQNTRG